MRWLEGISDSQSPKTGQKSRENGKLFTLEEKEVRVREREKVAILKKKKQNKTKGPFISKPKTQYLDPRRFLH